MKKAFKVLAKKEFFFKSYYFTLSYPFVPPLLTFSEILFGMYLPPHS